VIAGQGLDRFLEVFGKFKDADLKRIMKVHNITSDEPLKGKGAPKGPALVAILWRGAHSQRQRLEDRS
jgi:hypothetical protein